MTYKEAYLLLEDFVLTYAGWVPAEVFEALDELEVLVKAHTEKASYEEILARMPQKPEAFDSGVAIQTYHMAAIPIDPDIDARVEEMARKAKKPG